MWRQWLNSAEFMQLHLLSLLFAGNMDALDLSWKEADVRLPSVLYDRVCDITAGHIRSGLELALSDIADHDVYLPKHISEHQAVAWILTCSRDYLYSSEYADHDVPFLCSPVQRERMFVDTVHAHANSP